MTQLPWQRWGHPKRSASNSHHLLPTSRGATGPSTKPAPPSDLLLNCSRGSGPSQTLLSKKACA